MTVQLIRAVVVDDHPAMRAGIAAVLDQAPDIECCGEAASGAELWPLIQRTAPDVVVLDWHLPGDDGLVLCHPVKRHRPGRERHRRPPAHLRSLRPLRLAPPSSTGFALTPARASRPPAQLVKSRTLKPAGMRRRHRLR
jgi:Response regulator receiver domain